MLDSNDPVASVLPVREVTVALALAGELSPQSLIRFVDLIEQFGEHLRRIHQVTELEDVTPAISEAWINSPCSDGPATPSVRHFRRTAVRMLFRVARGLGLAEGDPTLDLDLPARAPGHCRALTDEEVGLCRYASVSSLEETRLPAAWALAEATARTSELSEILASDVDLRAGRVWFRGATFVEPRWGQLSEWGRVQVERRIRALCGSESRPLTYDGRGTGHARQAAACIAISSTIARAGLSDDPELRPLSVTAWAGRQILAAEGRIEMVARRLGMRSLDRTVRLIGFDWQRVQGSDDR